MTDGHNIVTKARLLLQSAKKYRKLPEIPQYHLTLYNNVEDWTARNIQKWQTYFRFWDTTKFNVRQSTD